MPVKIRLENVEPFKPVPVLLEIAIRLDKQPVVFDMDSKAKYVVSRGMAKLDTKKNLTAETLAAFASQKKEMSAPAAVTKAK